MRIRRVVGLLITFAALPQSVLVLAEGSGRTVRFPADRSLGLLYVREASSPNEDA
jgi:hypothetical protein